MDAPTFDGINVPEWKCQQPLEPEGAPTMQITTIGIDLAKNVFQIHGADQRGKAVLRKQSALNNPETRAVASFPGDC